MSILSKCPRCGDSHNGLRVASFKVPVLRIWTQWAMCPTTQEPILLEDTERSAMDDVFDRLRQTCMYEINKRVWEELTCEVRWGLMAEKGYW
jgi:hypothetical protein